MSFRIGDKACLRLPERGGGTFTIEHGEFLGDTFLCRYCVRQYNGLTLSFDSYELDLISRKQLRRI